jgi:hypothetical protein
LQSYLLPERRKDRIQSELPDRPRQDHHQLLGQQLECLLGRHGAPHRCRVRANELRNIESANECWHQSELLTELFGEEWHYPVGDRAKEENHKFTYLRRVVETVQAALRQEQQQGAAPTLTLFACSPQSIDAS